MQSVRYLGLKARAFLAHGVAKRNRGKACVQNPKALKGRA